MLEDASRHALDVDGGVRIAYLDFGGAGPPALLHHANGFCAATLALVAEGLRGAFRVFAMDARGHGDSSRPDGRGAYAWENFGRDAAAVARHIEAHHGRLALGLGHSFGGTALLLAALGAPQLYGRLLLVDPIVMPEDPAQRARSGPGNPLATAARKRRAVWDSREQARASWAGKPLFADWLPEALDLYVAEGLRERPDGKFELKCAPEVEATIFESTASVGLMAEARQLAVPACILWAARGNFPRSHFETLAARMPRGQVRDAAAGHLVPMEAPGLVVEEALRFSAPLEARAASSP